MGEEEDEAAAVARARAVAAAMKSSKGESGAPSAGGDHLAAAMAELDMEHYDDDSDGEGGGAMARIPGGNPGWLPGVWLCATGWPTTTMSTTAVVTVGASLGAGVIHVLGHARGGLKTSADIVEYLADQSARQCGPCINGMPRLARALSEIAYRSGSVHTQESIRYLADLVEGRGACKHPDGAVRLVRSSLHVFQHDLRMHAAGACEVNTRMGAAS